MHNKEDSKESLINDLQKKHKSYESKRLLHQKNERILKMIYYSFAGLSVILGVIIAFLSGALSIEDAEDPLSTAIFVLSLFNTMISAMISFSQMESKITRHHDNKLMFGDLELDLNAFLLDKNNDYNNYKNQEILMTEKEKMCRSAEQGNLFCFGV